MSYDGNNSNLIHYMEARNFPPEPVTPRAARKFVRDTLFKWNWSAVEVVALLLTSELVTNSVIHAGTSVQVNLHKESDFIRIEVIDAQTDTLPQIRHYSLDSATGRGLLLLKSMSRS